jgi:4-hydroxy-4-methyl-2-oxoglutarate aldolase
MAAQPPALTVRRRFPRPTEAQLAAFRGAPTGFVCDARGRRGALGHRIRRLSGRGALVGTALTANCGPRDNLTAWAAIGVARPGDVLVLATGAYEGASVAGDVMIGMARNAGVAAVVTDGMVRDLEGIAGVGIPVYAAGLTPNSPWKNGPGEVGLAVAVGGETVASGDVLVLDAEGVVVVPLAEADAVIAELEEVKRKEAKMDAAVRAGDTAPGWLAEALEAKGVRYVD